MKANDQLGARDVLRLQRRPLEHRSEYQPMAEAPPNTFTTLKKYATNSPRRVQFVLKKYADAAKLRRSLGFEQRFVLAEAPRHDAEAVSDIVVGSVG